MGEHVVNLKFKREVSRIPGAERLSNCYLCGTCTACCPVAEVDPQYNPKGIIQKVLYGMDEESLGSADLWKCTQCHTCVAHCPQDVRLADVIRALRVMAEARGFVSSELARRVREIDERSRAERLAMIAKAIEEYRG
jgi:heterodisulfide reductase subunit C